MESKCVPYFDSGPSAFQAGDPLDCGSGSTNSEVTSYLATTIMPYTVDELKKIDFETLTLEEHVKIIQAGRPKPKIELHQTATSRNGTYIRHFTYEWYKKKKWICGDEKKNALFCFPCLVMGCKNVTGPNAVWTEEGFVDLRRIVERVNKHEYSKAHLDNTVRMHLMGCNFNDFWSDTNEKSIIEHNESVRINRETLTKIIDRIKFCANFDEKDHSTNPSLVNFTSNLDPELEFQLNNNPAFKGCSTLIQNELLDCMLQLCREQIVNEIKETPFVAVMAEDTTDVSEHVQMAMVFRYVLNNNIYERFWGFFNPQNQETDGLAKCILDQIDIVLKNRLKLIAQTFDGAIVMKGQKSGVQAKIKESYENAHFVHCYSQKLSLIMENAARISTTSRIFFSNLYAISEFFSNSPYREKILNKYTNDRLPKQTKWTFNIKTVVRVYENLSPLKNCFQELQSTHQATDKTIKEASALLITLNDASFLFWLEFFNTLMPPVEIIYYQMQSKDISPTSIKKYLETFEESMFQLRVFYTKSSSSLSQEALNICNIITDDINERYKFTNHLIAAQLFNKKRLSKMEIPENEHLAVQSYDMIEQAKFLLELQIFHSRREIHGFPNLLSLLKFFTAHHIDEVLVEITKLIKILITTPMATAESERRFPTMKRIKNYLKRSTNEERLTALTMLSMEKDMISKMKNFNERTIDLFSTGKMKRTDFIYK